MYFFNFQRYSVSLVIFSLLTSSVTVRECGLYDTNSSSFAEIFLPGLLDDPFNKCCMCRKECAFSVLCMQALNQAC